MKKTVLITGGNSGIGFATARMLNEKGYSVCISGRNKEKVERAAGELGVDSFVADMASIDDIKKLASHFLGDGIDVLVNNAGIVQLVPLSDITEDLYSDILNINVRGPLFLIRELLPALKMKQGCIVNVSSIISTTGLPNTCLYAASKGAMDSFTRSLAAEFAPYNIRVNAISPGAIETPIYDKAGLGPDDIAAFKSHQEENVIPLGRFGSSEEVAQVILAQIESTYVTGSKWGVDGGVTAV